MYSRIGNSLASGLLAAVLMTGSPIRAANDSLPAGAEVLGRGPVHEAFAQPLEEVQAGPVAPKPPPEPIEEQPPEQRPEGDAVQWVPGYWQWDDERSEFLWVSGLWRNPPPSRKWVPGSWRQTDNGFQWSNGFWTPEASEDLQYLPAPPAAVEEGPSVESPGEDYTYVPGLWVYRETRYLWRPGYWLQCRPGWVWQPAHYVSTPAGCLYVAGCWDYPLESRGLLFAPVCFRDGIYPRVWTPRYTVGLDFLPSALFVRRGHGHYYYGDYFTAGYRRSGFTPWTDYRFARNAYDPLFGYYRSVNSGRPWERNVRGLYADRFAGRADRPPHNLLQQNATNVTVLRSLAQSASARTQLVPVGPSERARQHQHALHLRSAGTQRVKAERELVVRKEAPSRNLAVPKKVTIDLPKAHRASQPTERHTQPAVMPRIETPKQPRHVERHQHEALIEKPKSAPHPSRHLQTPHVERVVPHFETPKVSPRFEAPKVTPHFQTPKPPPGFDVPKLPAFHSQPARPAPAAKPAPHFKAAPAHHNSAKPAHHPGKPKK